MNLRQRDHVLALKAFPRAHALLVLALQSALAQVLYHRNEDILGVVFLEGEVAVAEVLPRGLIFLGGQFRIVILRA